MTPRPARRTPSSERRAAMPAAVALALAAIGSIGLWLHGTPADPQRLRAEADADFAAGRFDAAALRYQHLMALTPDAPEPAYRLALTMDRLHHRPEAVQVLTLIAPPTGGYLPAHLRLAEWLVEARMLGQNPDPALVADARDHLKQPFTAAADRQRAAELLKILDADGASP